MQKNHLRRASQLGTVLLLASLGPVRADAAAPASTTNAVATDTPATTPAPASTVGAVQALQAEIKIAQAALSSSPSPANSTAPTAPGSLADHDQAEQVAAVQKEANGDLLKLRNLMADEIASAKAGGDTSPEGKSALAQLEAAQNMIDSFVSVPAEPSAPAASVETDASAATDAAAEQLAEAQQMASQALGPQNQASSSTEAQKDSGGRHHKLDSLSNPPATTKSPKHHDMDSIF